MKNVNIKIAIQNVKLFFKNFEFYFFILHFEI